MRAGGGEVVGSRGEESGRQEQREKKKEGTQTRRGQYGKRGVNFDWMCGGSSGDSWTRAFSTSSKVARLRKKLEQPCSLEAVRELLFRCTGGEFVFNLPNCSSLSAYRKEYVQLDGSTGKGIRS